MKKTMTQNRIKAVTVMTTVKHYKKAVLCTFLLFIAGLTVISLASCAGRTSDSKKTDGRPVAVATNFAMYDFTRAVCGDIFDVRMLLSPGTDSHDFEATLAELSVISEADVFVYVGGESEEWVDDTVEAAGLADGSAYFVRALDFVDTYETETVEGMADENEEHSDHEHETDEHCWTSIPNAVKIIEEIEKAAISAAGEDSREQIEENTDSYIAKLNEIDAEIRETVTNAKRRTLVFADRFPLRYFVEEYGLSYYAAFSGCTSSVEPPLATVNFLIDKVKSENIPDVLVIEMSDRKTADAVANETGCGVLTMESAHNVTKQDFESGVTYADLMKRNIAVLQEVLN